MNEPLPTAQHDLPAPRKSDVESWTPINVALPLPLDVASTLVSLIGAAYPSAVIVNPAPYGRYGLSMKIDPAERRDVTAEAAAAAKSYVDAEADDLKVGETALTSMGSDWIGLATPEDLSLHLGSVAHALFTSSEGAINYIEWTVRTEPEPGTKRSAHEYVLFVAKSKGQTPGALRQAAEAAREQAEARAEAAETLLAEVRHAIETNVGWENRIADSTSTDSAAPAGASAAGVWAQVRAALPAALFETAPSTRTS